MPTFEGRVETPETPVGVNNYIVQQARAAETPEEINELILHAQRHGYSNEGQTIQFLTKRHREVSEGAPKPTAASRGGKTR